ncbi:EF-hand domain-containing protein D1 isoform X2 [Scyliorhinus canicula]|uniref:EF-hand domain-containing protein D1 isoform X2 n=1 Tax=Scyliorhinus canicula TaxID=7830 RepID=UPI0018F3AA03|nr:EF-hand domain-containing protein D1 isoform X2 [Scyliorhinus canicula]
MASEELAKKLQRRLMLEMSTEDAADPIAANNNYLAVGAGDPEEKPAISNADTELSAKLTRRLGINEGTTAPKQAKVFNPYTEFKEFTRKQIKDMEKMFKLYDSGKDGFIDLMELKLMMEKLGAPQTHIGLKNMIKEVDEDFDGKLNFREVQALTTGSKFEAEIIAEKEQRKRMEEDRKQRRAAFKELKAAFM